VHNQPETLGSILKAAREIAGITIEALAEKAGITERYLYRIENEGKKPSFDVLYKLIRELSISADSIFYPEKPSKDSEVENLLRMLSACDERSLKVVKATVKVLIDTAPQK
jgi:transcriptional regulator with XRE-family HTH domain